MTVVLPAPVASLSARRARPGFACSLAAARWSRKRRPSLPSPGGTSVSQIAVSAASTWHEEGPDVGEAVPLASRACLVAAPVLEEPGRLRCHAPPSGVRNRPPRVDPAPQLVDDLHQLVLLTLRLQRLRRLIEDQRTLAALFRSRDRRDERHATASVEDAARRLAALVEFPVPRRVLVGRVEDGAVEEVVAHGSGSLSQGSARGAFPEAASGRARTAQSFDLRRSVVHVS